MNKKIFEFLLLFFSFVFLFYNFYKSEIFYEGLYRDKYFKYYFVCIFFIIVSVFLFFVNKIIKKYFIIVFLSSIATIYIFELYLFSKETNLLIKNYDKRTKRQIYTDLKKQYPNIKVNVNPTNFLNKKTDIFPTAGISNVKTIFCNEDGEYKIYDSDRHGFNNPDIVWESIQFEYLILGDSFVHGACVDRSNNISSNLTDLSNKSVLNLGWKWSFVKFSKFKRIF